MKIHEVCKKTGYNKQTIHFYIKERLIAPSVDPSNGYYSFSENDCQKLCLIRELRNAGFSLSVIRAIIERPSTAGYYLNIHVRELKRERKNLDKNISSLESLLERIPIHLEFSSLYELTMSADIPDPSVSDNGVEYINYDNSLVNLFLWSGFLPTEKFTDYQEFLWNKLLKITNDSPNPDYRTMYEFLRKQDQKSIDSLFMTSSEYYETVSTLTPDTFEVYADLLYKKLNDFLYNENYIRTWKKNYYSFFAPNTRVFASSLGNIIAEISPLFASYRKNINQICRMIYDRLLTDTENDFLKKLQKELGEHLDLANYNHGQIAAITSFDKLTAISKS
ncbi:MAG: MerR family transcriptional regulator [Blautia glucerasea]|jgi:DNA-binding transcriptional MerR regulator|nr:MerR family transcriptional regulator [Blautia glucerasea]MDY6222386.1 MerR family transcriptional regulator [Candidatus Alectryocaccobium sp.]